MTETALAQPRDRRRDPGRQLAAPHAVTRAVLAGIVGVLYLILVAPFGPVRSTLRRTLERGRGVYSKILELQTRVLLSIVYVLVILPLSLAMRLFRKSPLDQPRESEAGYWSPHKPAELSIDRYRRMF